MENLTIFEKDRAKKSFKHWIEYFDLSIEDIRDQYSIRINLGKNGVFTSLMREYIINDYEFNMLCNNSIELHIIADDYSLDELEREAASNMLLRVYPEYYENVYNDTEEPREY